METVNNWSMHFRVNCTNFIPEKETNKENIHDTVDGGLPK